MWLIFESGVAAPCETDAAKAARTIAASAANGAIRCIELPLVILDPGSLARTARLRFGSMRICLVTPFAWSQPHDVNDHVAGVADALRRFGHEVTVLAPSTRAADLLAGRRALARAERPDVIAVGAAVRI